MNPIPDLSSLAQWPTAIVLGLCSFAGLALKGIPTFRNWLIPFCVGGLGGVAGWALLSQTLNGLLLGILLGGISVYGHQLVTQFLRRNDAPNDAGKPSFPGGGPITLLMLGLILPFLTGCGSTQPAPDAAPAAVVGSAPSPTDQFWAAMKGDAVAAGDFLRSDVAKKNAPLFFRVCWKGAFAGYGAAGGNVPDLASAVNPFCNAIAGFTSASGVSIAQIEAASAAVGPRIDLTKYDPMANAVNPVLEWFIQMLPDDPALALFYIHTAAQAGFDVSGGYLTVWNDFPQGGKVEIRESHKLQTQVRLLPLQPTS